MNRDDGRAMWQRIAGGELSGNEQWAPEDPWEWIQDVARRVLEADEIKTTNERERAIVTAVGLSGHRDGYGELRRFVEQCLDFPPLDEDGNEIHQTQGQKVADVVRLARLSGLLVGNYAIDDKKAKDLIRDLLHQRK